MKIKISNGIMKGKLGFKDIALITIKSIQYIKRCQSTIQVQALTFQ